MTVYVEDTLHECLVLYDTACIFAGQTDIFEVCPSPLVLAHQLTHVELERLSMIGPEEFVQVFVKESSDNKNHKQVGARSRTALAPAFM